MLENATLLAHPMQGDEIRALRRLQRVSSHVFMTERDVPPPILGWWRRRQKIA